METVLACDFCGNLTDVKKYNFSLKQIFPKCSLPKHEISFDACDICYTSILSDVTNYLSAKKDNLNVKLIVEPRTQYTNTEDEDPGRCAICGKPFELVRPGKSQPTCSCYD